ncbi:MAG: tRNA (adenosine(37)-N6)-threonylcarbamoyltransferase complex dimerization subunit type 1 TsaB [Sandaracinaceae bacterium]|nr:tRNA (adenosine(37)-N6)-threonylcarbamoyltransferase complex dimerization subunit type 1 TsaB [Sandaracinaceae bacterium]
MRVLSIETSTDLGAVACVEAGALRAEVAASVRARHGERLFALLEQALDHAGWARADVDLVACGLGPGSFTGTRVGVAAAKGLALALDRPIRGVSSLVALALGAPGALLAPVADAHQGEVFLAVYERTAVGLLERLAPLHAGPEAALAALAPFGGAVVFGAGARRYPDVLCPMLPAIHDAPRAALIALEAEARFAAEGPHDRAALEPLYVRPSDAKLPC